jgi:methylglutaconyl-CoA hydratase
VKPLDTLLQSVSDRGIATITFNRPDRANSYDSALLDALCTAFEQYGRDSKVRVIVLRGAGKHFSAGAAIGEGAVKPRLSMGEACALIDAVPKPTLAVVQGACIGGALAIASSCDMIIAGREATFSIPEVRLGFAPGPLIGTFVRAMGYRAVRRYLLSGERFSAEEALRIGLVGTVCETGALDRECEAWIDQCLLGAPGAIARAKQMLQRNAAPPALSAEQIRELQTAFEAVSFGDEAAEGRASFKEKRKPKWYPAK